MKCIKLAIIITISFLPACRRQKQVHAKIFERRELNDTTLVILYQYNIENKTYIDSANIKNIVISNDSIILKADPSRPDKWIPELKN